MYNKCDPLAREGFSAADGKTITMAVSYESWKNLKEMGFVKQ